MATTLSFKDLIDIPNKWRPLNSIPFNNYGGYLAGCSDPRSGADSGRIPYLFGTFSSSNTFQAYNFLNDSWQFLSNFPSSFGAGVAFAFAAAQGPRGTITTGSTTTSVVLSTALPAAVTANQLANKGDKSGYKIRIIDNGSGGSGKIYEGRIIGNTSGTTPTITVESVMGFTPVTGSAYEFLSGKVYAFQSNSVFYSYDVACQVWTSLSTANISASGDTPVLIHLDELAVPSDRNPGQGIYGNLTATGIAAGSITGQASSGDASVVSNQFRNYQIRIIQDTTNTTAVGQRRKISSHTAGPSAVYTLASNWSVTPSATAQFVIENYDDNILVFGATSVHVNNYSISGNTWDTSTTWADAPAAGGTGQIGVQAYGLISSLDGLASPLARHSFIYRFRGGGTNTLDLFDISAGANGVWTSNISYFNKYTNEIVVGPISCIVNYDPWSNNGRFFYYIVNQNNQGVKLRKRFDLLTGVVEPFSSLIGEGDSFGNLSGGVTYWAASFADGGTILTFIFHPRLVTGNSSSTNEFYSLAVSR